MGFPASPVSSNKELGGAVRSSGLLCSSALDQFWKACVPKPTRIELDPSILVACGPVHSNQKVGTLKRQALKALDPKLLNS